jgi:hypothetical protein
MAARPLGAWYAVVLTAPDFSLGHTAVVGALGASSSFPTPDLGERCVCCDGETTARRHFDASTDRFRADPIAIPLCADCGTHVQLNTSNGQLAGALVCVGLGGAIWGAAAPSLAAVAAGSALLAAIAAWIAAGRRARLKQAARGHHCGFEILISPRLCSVRTTNPRLAEELVERNRARVHRASFKGIKPGARRN